MADIAPFSALLAAQRCYACLMECGIICEETVQVQADGRRSPLTEWPHKRK